MAKREAVSSLDTEGKLKALDQIEKQLVSAIKNCGQVIGELGNEKISEKNAVKMTDKFIKEIDEVEGALTNQIHYLSQVTCSTTHEGSVYGQQKEMEQMATAHGSANLRIKKLMEITHPDKYPVPDGCRPQKPN
ncbi:unnamed protein product [Oikopleura dioica]|uniref:Mediator of RNA polymerase II transcription subunit 11 n=1 Tax=Oikopleura dioica TaxID=34765 RepID=E4YDG3_OIKDI|nr:unnamed protein product [Oikopleura dioica]